MTLGAYLAVAVNVWFSQNILIAAAVAVIGVGLFSVALESILFRPMRGTGSASIFIITIGLALVMRYAIYLMAGANTQQYGVNQYDVYDLGIVRLSPGQVIVTVTSLVVVPLVGLFLARTRVGKSMRAIADNADLAAVSGIDPDRIAIYTWAIAGALAGLAGVLLGLLQGTFTPELGWNALFLIFTAIILGGIGSAYGALVGGLVLGLVMEVSTWSALAGGLDPRYKPVVAFILLIALLLYRPQGFFGKVRLL